MNTTQTTSALADHIRRTIYPAWGGREGFLSDPGGILAYCGEDLDDDLAAAAIDLLAQEADD